MSERICHSNKARLYLYLNNDVEYFQDGTRLSKEERDKLDSFHRQVLKESNIPVIEISGNWEERFQQAVEHIRSLITSQGRQYRLMP